MNRKVLLVEDDKNICQSLTAYLQSEGYSVHSANSMMKARAEIITCRPEILVLDWILPDGQGLDFLKELRLEGHQMPVIILTARTELIDKVLGLESGADDYLTKPFEPRELVARIRVRLRETPPRPPCQLSYAGIALDLDSREATYNGLRLELTKLEFDLLKLFIESPGRVFTRESILNKVWGFENFPTTRTVDNHVVQLRQKTHPDLFETVRGVGYRLMAGKK